MFTLIITTYFKRLTSSFLCIVRVRVRVSAKSREILRAASITSIVYMYFFVNKRASSPSFSSIASSARLIFTSIAQVTLILNYAKKGSSFFFLKSNESLNQQHYISSSTYIYCVYNGIEVFLYYIIIVY